MISRRIVLTSSFVVQPNHGLSVRKPELSNFSDLNLGSSTLGRLVFRIPLWYIGAFENMFRSLHNIGNLHRQIRKSI